MFKQLSVISLLICLLHVSSLSATSVRISQVDSSGLLLNQQVKLYLSVTDARGKPLKNLKQDSFKVLESADGNTYEPVETITGFQTGINYTDGVTFLLLVDNSESMYWDMNGRKNSKPENMRISIAKNAISAFLKSIKNPKDRVGISTYNSYYRPVIAPGNDLNTIQKQLGTIERPKGDEIYSEIYGSLDLAVDEFDVIKGRKAIVILSDGVNNPAYPHTKKINEQFGRKVVPYTQPLQSLQREGISIYVIYFGKKSDRKDRHLKTIAMLSGGVTFDASNQRQLSRVYSRIMDQIQNEVVLDYEATMSSADRKYVKVEFGKGRAKKRATRYYLSGSVFGNPSDRFNPLFLLTTLLAVFLLWLLSKVKFEKQRKNPSLEVLNAGSAKLSTQVVTLGGEQTVIGASPSADMTIAGLPAVEENHATIVFDAGKNRYTLEGRGKMMVNNQVVTTKILEPGDLINIDGATMVFDEGSESTGEK